MTKPRPTGTWPAVEPIRPWIVVATNRKECGRPLRAVTADLKHLEHETGTSRFARFATRAEAEAWLERVRWHLVAMSNDYTYTPVEL